MSTITDIAERFKARVTPAVIRQATKWKGTDCDIFFPHATNSVYGQADNQYSYDRSSPDFSGLVLITGITEERREGDRTQDTFDPTPPAAWSDATKEWPRNTLIRAKFKNMVRFFRVDVVLGTYGHDRMLYRHYELIPVEDKS